MICLATMNVDANVSALAMWLGSSLGSTLRNPMQGKRASQGFIGKEERTIGKK